jgi:hypothetical protein
MKPKSTLVWRTGLYGVPPDSVQCTRVVHSELATFGFQDSCSAIIHGTVRCATGLSGAPAEQRLQRNGRLQRTPAKALQCADSSRRVRAAARGAPDNAQYLSGAHRTVRYHMKTKAPTVEIVRTLTVG